MQVPNPTTQECDEIVSQHAHDLDLLIPELQLLNTEQNDTVDDIAERMVKLEKILALLKVTVDSNDTYLDHK